MIDYKYAPNNLERWVSLFRQLINERKQDSNFVGNQHFQTVADNIDNLTADEICNQIVKACEDVFGSDEEGRVIIGKNKENSSILLVNSKSDEYSDFVRFVEPGDFIFDMGLSKIGSKRYQFYRNENGAVQYHNERFGGTVRRTSTIYVDDDKYYNPDGSRDWGRSIRDLWEALKNG